MGSEDLLGKERCAQQDCRGFRTGGSRPQGGGGGRALLLLCPSALAKATPVKAGAGLTQGERLLTSGKAPPFLPTYWGGGALPWWWETAATAPCTPPPLRLPGRRAPAVAAGGCQHPCPRGAPAQAPTLPPSQAPTLGRGGGGRSSRNLRGAGCGSRGPSLLFHKPGPSQEQCRT